VGPDDLVVGEAVALELPPATVVLRVASGLLDIGLAVVLLVGGTMVAAIVSSGTDAALSSVAGLVAVVVVLLGIPVASETFFRGRTLGKWATGLRAVRDDAGPISFRHALTRGLVGVVEIWILGGVPALISALVSRKGKRIGDHVAGTYVVRDRFRLQLVQPPAMPGFLIGWAQVADIAALPTGLTLAVRQYLLRANALTPEARDVTGRRLAAQVATFVAPPPPEGTPPSMFLAAVLAERRERDLRRLRNDEALRHRLARSAPTRP
jgi:uncharacterized RDD family membrane protein YckC